MTNHDEWINIAANAWERHGVGCQYTIHKENDQWVARGFALRDEGTAVKEAEESAQTAQAAKQIVQQWESEQKLARAN